MRVKDVMELDINILGRDDKDLIGFVCDGVYLGDFTKAFILNQFADAEFKSLEIEVDFYDTQRIYVTMCIESDG